VLVGVAMVTKQFLEVFENYGVKTYPTLGQPFDPERHEAVGQTPTAEKKPGTILDEVQKGYFIQDRLLRPAKVVIATAVDASRNDATNATTATSHLD